VAPSGQGIFSQILTDFRNLPSTTNLTILGVGGIGAGLGHVYDTRISNGLMASSGSGSATGIGNTLGSMQVQFGAALATYTLGKVSHSPRVTTIGADLVRAQIVTQTLTQGIKFATGRTRPDGTSYSFPSGHTSTAFATATVLQRHLGWKAGIPAYGLATFVAASRVESKRHYLSDVAFGAALGIVAGRTVTIGRGEARFAVSPAAAPGGGGVNFTWVGKK
jgi:membrane-associated phospholipid phosphatase